ncbi:unnamed protein product [Bursaphelenchus xylophilus]|uniref:(pine wood nematode) hypothetical protein n=1 Tax=Bursaphelenchus xylophilus TaxID=6326 RepID=A0A1I7RKZ8_BURXY|nr:unnamed protein product [Bursaphelenchus xylophilus]CAG9083660.1 unnamed protein product [Bursaphelenchus xylophilus]
MVNPLEGHFRIFILIVTTWGLSILFANVLSVPFNVICMTEGKYRWEDFSIDLGTDVFTRIDWDPPKPTQRPSSDFPDIPSGWPDVDIPGIRVPVPGFNWQGLRLARQHPDLFLRLLQKVAKEVSYRAAVRVGEALDPRDIDFRRFLDGFNLTDYDPNVVFKVKNYVLDRIKSLQHSMEVTDIHGRRLSRWDNVTVDDIKFQNITWNGVINGRVRIVEKPPAHTYTPWEKTWLYSIAGLGTLLSVGPFNKAFEHFGCRKTVTVAAVISALSTGLIPLGASLGYGVFIILRILQGVGFAVVFPVIGYVTSSWASLTEDGLFNGALTSFIQIAALITMPLSGTICHITCWSLSYFLHALLTVVFVIVWWCCYRDSPSESETVSLSELRRIQDGKVTDFRLKHSKIPYQAIHSDLSVWAVWVAAVGKLTSIVVLLFYLPIYLHKNFEYDMLIVGWVLAIPFLLQFVVKLGSGILSDNIKGKTETVKVKVFNSVAFFVASFFLILAAFIQSADLDCLTVIIISAAIVVLGLDAAGFFKSSTVIGRQYSHYINIYVQTVAGLSILLSPLLVQFLAPTTSMAEWILVFCLLVVVLALSGIFFVLKGSGITCAFADVAQLPENSKELKELNKR